MVEKGDGKRVKEGDGKKCKKVALPTTLFPNKPTPTQNYSRAKHSIMANPVSATIHTQHPRMFVLHFRWHCGML